MKHLLFNGLLLVLLLHTSSVSSEVIDKIVADIDGGPITYTEVQEEYKKINPEYDVSKKLTQDEVKFGLTSILIQKEATKMGLAVSNEEVESHIDEVIQQNNLSRENFIDALKSNGSTLESYKSKLINEITRNRVISAVLKQRIQVNNEELQSYMGNEDVEKREDKNTFGLFKIETLVRDFDAREEAVKLSAYLKNGGQCEKYTSQYFKTCENLGIFKQEDLKQDYSDALRNSELYVFSEVIVENGLNYILFKVDSEVSQSLSKTGQNIKDKLLQEKFKKEAEKYLTKEIFDAYHVEFHY